VGDSLVKRAAIAAGSLGVLSALSPAELEAMHYAWELNARPEQMAPDGAWLVWLLLAGRGFGKSRTGAEWARAKALAMPGSHGALVAPTSADTRDVMVKALVECSHPSENIIYEPSKRRLAWSNGTSATLYSAEEPDRLRGPQHAWAWCDEIAAWQYPDEVWDMLMMTRRVGDMPQVVASTTPRPIPLVRRIMSDRSTVITRGSTFDNADNLSPAFLASVKDRYEGTRLGRQELFAEILDDVPGALWTFAMLDGCRVSEPPAMRRIVVAVDPSGTGANEDAKGDEEGTKGDEQGIVVAGLGVDGRGYVLEDVTCKLSPDGWGRRVVEAYQRHKADRVVYERNYGGDMVEHVIATAARSMGVTVATRMVVASRGKVVRAEPIAALYEQGKVSHVGVFRHLEDQMCKFTPSQEFIKSPDRADALVWALTELMTGEPVASFGGASFRAPGWTFGEHPASDDDAM
jgi:predicted phage terminase large subunit-like protein